LKEKNSHATPSHFFVQDNIEHWLN
jgi:hypothetical protein